MNARTDARRLEALRGSPQLTAAVEALARYSRRQPDPTLEEVQHALLGTGFTWSAERELTFAPERAALVNELDELIAAYGCDTRAAWFFPTIVAEEPEPS